MSKGKCRQTCHEARRPGSKDTQPAKTAAAVEPEVDPLTFGLPTAFRCRFHACFHLFGGPLRQLSERQVMVEAGTGPQDAKGPEGKAKPKAI